MCLITSLNIISMQENTLNISPIVVYVNYIYSEGKIDHGIAATENCIEKNFKKIFTPKDREVLIPMFKEVRENFYFFNRFCQYVVYTQFQIDIGFTMKFTDYKSDLDTAIDEFKLLQENQWEESDIAKIMKIFDEIQLYKGNTCKMILEPIKANI